MRMDSQNICNELIATVVCRENKVNPPTIVPITPCVIRAGGKFWTTFGDDKVFHSILDEELSLSTLNCTDKQNESKTQ